MKNIIVLLTTTLLFIGCLSVTPSDRPDQSNLNTSTNTENPDIISLNNQEAKGSANQASTDHTQQSDITIQEDEPPNTEEKRIGNIPGYIPVSDNENEVIHVKHDDSQNVTFYQHYELYRYAENIMLYISLKGNSKDLRLGLMYNGSDWLFFDTAILTNENDNRLDMSFNSDDKHTDVYWDGSLYEKIDTLLLLEQIDLIETILKNGSIIKLQLSGARSEDYQIPENIVSALLDMIDFYRNL